MIRILTFLFPLCAMGLDLSVRREAGLVHVVATNIVCNCIRFDWNTDLTTNGWRHFRTLYGSDPEPVSKYVSFSVVADSQRVFWRAEYCAVP